MKLSKQHQFFKFINVKYYSQRGFTLVEMLVVIAIIALVSAIGYGTFIKLRENARINATELIIEAVASAMDARSSNITSAQRAAVSIPPEQTFHSGDGSETSTNDLIAYLSGNFGVGDEVTSVLPQVDVNTAGTANSYVEDVNGQFLIVDSWGTPLRYTFPGDHNTHDDGFDLESAGPDKDFDEDSDNIILE